MARAVNSEDVARRAGVSRATVSLVLNGAAARVGVSAATQHRVLAAAAALGYTPNHAARSLRRRRTGIVALVLADVGNPYFAEVLAAAQAVAQDRGYVVTVMAARTEAAERQALERLRGGICDGVLTAARSAVIWSELRRLSGQGVACVVLQDASDDPAIPSVRIDVETGGYLATRHLVALGHRRIAHITDRLHYARRPNDRLEGWRRALHEAGLTPDADWLVEADNTMAGGYAAMVALLGRAAPPSAVFAFNDHMALGALHAAADRGWRVPRDVSVIGFDGIALGGFTRPELTTIEHPREELGRRAMATLLGLLDGTVPECGTHLLPVKLLVRQSCGPAPAEARPRRKRPTAQAMVA